MEGLSILFWVCLLLIRFDLIKLKKHLFLCNHFKTQVIAVLVDFVPVARCGIVCPNFADFAPCYCVDNGDGQSIYLDCSYQNLNDSATTPILNSFLSNPNVDPVVEMNLSDNQLTQIPNEIRYFDYLQIVDLDFNKILSIKSGAFNFTSRLRYLYLNGNPTGHKINYIEPGAFLGKILHFH